MSYHPATCVVVCDLERSLSVLCLLTTCFGTGDFAGDELPRFPVSTEVHTLSSAGSGACL